MIFTLAYVCQRYGTEYYEEYPKGIPPNKLDGYGLINRSCREACYYDNVNYKFRRVDDPIWVHYRRHQRNRVSEVEKIVLEQKRKLLFEGFKNDFIGKLILVKDLFVNDVLHLIFLHFTHLLQPSFIVGYRIVHNLVPMTKVKRPASQNWYKTYRRKSVLKNKQQKLLDFAYAHKFISEFKRDSSS